MSYCTTYNGYIKINKPLPNELVSLGKDTFENFWCDENSIDFGGYDRYDEDPVYEFLTKVAPYTTSGEIEYKGEDGNLWRFIFEDGEWKEEDGRIIYGSNFVSKEMRLEFIGQIIDIFDDILDPDNPAFTGKKFDEAQTQLEAMMKAWRVFE